MTDASEQSGLSGERFHCRLDDLPAHLVPHGRGWRNSPADREELLFLNPHFGITTGCEIPWSLPGGTPAGFALPATVAWVGDATAGDLKPFWLGQELESMLAGRRSGDPAPSALTPEMRGMLACAEVLVPMNYPAVRVAQREGMLSDCARIFANSGYAPVAGLIHPFHIAALRRYYRRLIRKGKMPLGDFQSANRYVLHNESVARFFHQQITPVLARIIGCPVKPSYVYFAAYLPGAELRKHQDREQCEFSITLCLDYSPEPRLATPWPLHLETGSKRVTVFQAIGDGLLYRGRELCHYRDPLPANCTSTSMFFHYVAEDFAGPLD